MKLYEEKNRKRKKEDRKNKRSAQDSEETFEETSSQELEKFADDKFASKEESLPSPDMTNKEEKKSEKL